MRYVVLLLLAGCGSSPEQVDRTAQALSDAGGDGMPSEAATEPTADAAAEVGAPQGPRCAALGESCTVDTDCLCSGPGGCWWDNVVCAMGHCATNGAPVPPSNPNDPGDPGALFSTCCVQCEVAYDGCDGGSCAAALVACSAACKGINGFPSACPVGCSTPR